MDLTTIIGIVAGLALIIFGGCGKLPVEYFKADGEAF